MGRGIFSPLKNSFLALRLKERDLKKEAAAFASKVYYHNGNHLNREGGLF